MKIKYWDYSREYRFNKKKYFKNLSKVFNSGSLILGNEVKKIENNISRYLGCKYSVGVNSGTDALLISLFSLGIKNGDEILTTSNTAIPTVSAIVSSGAKPVYVDIKESDYLIDEEKIKKNITKNSKAIVVVHLYGQSPNMKKILNISKKFNLKVIEDCAHSFGAKYSNKKLGSFGDVAAFSFYPTKILGAFGDGGMIVTNNKKIYKKLKLLRFYGIESGYISKMHGINSRIDEIQAAILNQKIKEINYKIKKRRNVAEYYNKNIINKKIILPTENSNNYHVYYNYVIRSKSRDRLKSYLFKKGVETKIIYPYPIHKMKPYSKSSYIKSSLNITEKINREILSLPIYPEIKKNELKKIVNLINLFV